MKQKIAIVTGGTKGIGLATVKELSEKDFLVFFGSRHNVDNLGLNENCIFHELDVSSCKSCKDFIDFVMSKTGEIDSLVNCAGIIRDSLTSKMTDEDFDEVISINLKGTFNMVRLIGPLMMANGVGSIVNISSISGEYGNMGQANYSASKAGIIAMTKSWAREFTRHGENVRVNAVAPGFIDTDMISKVPNGILEKIKEQTFLKRFGSPEEVAKVIAFLLGEESSYITGSVIDVNGGLRI